MTDYSEQEDKPRTLKSAFGSARDPATDPDGWFTGYALKQQAGAVVWNGDYLPVQLDKERD